MRSRLAVMIVTGVACQKPPVACTGPEVLTSCPACAAGEIRQGLAMPGLPIVAKTGDAAAVGSCDRIDWVAPAATTPAIARFAPGSSVLDVAPDGAGGVYAAVSSTESSGFQLVAIAADGTRRWSASAFDHVASAPEGPYAWQHVATGVQINAFADDGRLRWTQTIPWQDDPGLVGAAAVVGRPTSGFFVRISLPTIATFDANGTAVSSLSVPFGDALGWGSTDDGGLAIVFPFVGQITVAGVTLTDNAPLGSTFVGVIDDAKARWAYATPSTILVDSLHSWGDKLVGMTSGLSSGPGCNRTSSITVFTVTAFDHALAIGGPGNVNLTSIAPASDGSVWLGLETAPVSDSCDPSARVPGLTIGHTTYVNPSYDPRGYVANLVL